MKKLSMVVHSSLQMELADSLRKLQVESFMFSHIEQHSVQHEHDPILSATDKVVGYVPQVRVDVLLPDERAHSLLDELRCADCPLKGKGIYWITDLDDYGDL